MRLILVRHGDAHAGFHGVIGGHAGIYFVLGAAAGRWDIALAAAQFFIYIAIANLIVDAWRHWYRHHG